MYKYQTLYKPKKYLFLTLITIIISAMPLLMVTLPWGGSACFLLLFISGLFFSINNLNNTWSILIREYPYFTVAILSWCLLIGGQMITIGPVSGRNFEVILRFAAGFVILPLAASSPIKKLKNIEWGIIVGAFSVFFFAVLTVFIMNEETGRGGNFFTNAITFGNISLLLGFWSLISLGWDNKDSFLKKTLKFIAFFAAIYASFLSGSRGGWLAIPFFVWILMHITLFKSSLRKKHIVTFAILCFILGIFSKDFISNRLGEVVTDLKLYQTGITETSIGERVQLWKGSLIIFSENPIFGVGRGNFKKEIQNLATHGTITNNVTQYDHSHNEILFMMAQFGIIGLIVLLLFYYCTIASFYPYLRHQDATIKTSAHMGIILSSGFIIFGFTEVFFDKVKTIGFFIVMASSFLGIIASQKRNLAELKVELERSDSVE